VPRGTGDGLGSSDGLRPKSEGKRETRGATRPFFAVRMKKTAAEGLVGLVAGDALMLFFIVKIGRLVICLGNSMCKFMALAASRPLRRRLSIRATATATGRPLILCTTTVHVHVSLRGENGACKSPTGNMGGIEGQTDR
jgi:hypothetical protein